MNFSGIEAFLAIVEKGSISKAAELLHLSQSSVSYRLKTLENELGFKLIDRNQGIHGISLTSYGEGYLNIAEKLMDLQKEIELISREGSKLNLIIGTADSISLYIMPSLYKFLVSELKDARVNIITQHTLETYESVKKKEIDIGFVKREFHMPNVSVEKISDEEMVLVRLKHHNNAEDIAIQPNQLHSKNEIFMDWGQSYQIWHDYWWKPNDYLIRVDAAALIFELMEDEKHWAIVPRSIFNKMNSEGKYIEQKLTSIPPNRTYFMATHKFKDRKKENAYKMIENFLKKY
ncbi:LysR family transcriptional regulator [Wukongibacter sp. M2B1]|uniref:LysR family transcriptional regulator n=1 Tax=Wukongibacter sp. M2B1 TaxID=3088895 RepID=UPI003D7BA1D3